MKKRDGNGECAGRNVGRNRTHGSVGSDVLIIYSSEEICKLRVCYCSNQWFEIWNVKTCEEGSDPPVIKPKYLRLGYILDNTNIKDGSPRPCLTSSQPW